VVVDRTTLFEVVTRQEQHYSLPTSNPPSTRLSRPDNVYSPLTSVYSRKPKSHSFFIMELPHWLRRRHQARSVSPSLQTYLKSIGVASAPTLQGPFHLHRLLHLSIRVLTGHRLIFPSGEHTHPHLIRASNVPHLRRLLKIPRLLLRTASTPSANQSTSAEPSLPDLFIACRPPTQHHRPPSSPALSHDISHAHRHNDIGHRRSRGRKPGCDAP
jgi:hypothetical protein